MSPVARGSVPFAQRDVAALLAGERRGSPVDAVAGQSAALLEHLSLRHMAEQPNPRHRRPADAPFAAGSDMGSLMRLLYGADHDGPCCGMPVGRATRRVPRRDDHPSHYPQRPTTRKDRTPSRATSLAPSVERQPAHQHCRGPCRESRPYRSGGMLILVEYAEPVSSSDAEVGHIVWISDPRGQRAQRSRRPWSDRSASILAGLAATVCLRSLRWWPGPPAWPAGSSGGQSTTTPAGSWPAGSRPTRVRALGPRSGTPPAPAEHVLPVDFIHQR